MSAGRPDWQRPVFPCEVEPYCLQLPAQPEVGRRNEESALVWGDAGCCGGARIAAAEPVIRGEVPFLQVAVGIAAQERHPYQRKTGTTPD